MSEAVVIPISSGDSESATSPRVEAPATAVSEAGAPVQLSSPPPAAMPVRHEADPRERLHELARELIRTRNRQLMLEYLRLRRALS